MWALCAVVLALLATRAETGGGNEASRLTVPCRQDNATEVCQGPDNATAIRSFGRAQASGRATSDETLARMIFKSLVRSAKELLSSYMNDTMKEKQDSDTIRGYIMKRKMITPMLVGMVMLLLGLVPLALGKLVLLGLSAIASSKLALLLISIMTFKKVFMHEDANPHLRHVYAGANDDALVDLPGSRRRVLVIRGRELGPRRPQDEEVGRTPSGRGRTRHEYRADESPRRPNISREGRRLWAEPPASAVNAGASGPPASFVSELPGLLDTPGERAEVIPEDYNESPEDTPGPNAWTAPAGMHDAQTLDSGEPSSSISGWRRLDKDEEVITDES